MSLNHILSSSALAQSEPINISVHNCDVKNELSINGAIIPNPTNILLLDEVSAQTSGYIPIFKGSSNEIEQSTIKTDASDLDINNNKIKNSTSYKLSNNADFKIGDDVEASININGSDNLIFKDTETKTNKNFNTTNYPLLVRSIITSLTPSTFVNNELNIDSFRTRIKTNLNDGFYFIASDGIGGDLTAVKIANNNGDPRMSFYNNANYNVNTPTINNGGNIGLAFKNTTEELILCVTGQEKIKMGPTNMTYNTPGVHTFFGQIQASNGFFGSVGDLMCQNLTITNNAYMRVGFHSPLAIATGYDLTNIILMTITTENIWNKILLSSNVIGTPSALTIEMQSNGGADFGSGNITVNATGIYLITINLSLRKVLATGSRFILIGIGLNNAQPPAAVGRMVCSLSSNIDDWNSYSASNIIQLTAFNSYGLWLQLMDLGGTTAQNVYISDISTSIIKIS